jgi:hypothetical protein
VTISEFPYGGLVTAAWLNSVRDRVNAISDQGSFADATARNAAITSPVEGMVAYLTTPDYLTIYQGGAWRLLASVGATSYTPTLTNFTIGTGGSAANSASWTYSGGMLRAWGSAVLGTSGASVAGATSLTLPSGFTLASTTTARQIGNVSFNDSGTDYMGTVRPLTGTSVALVVDRADTTYRQLTNTGSTVPFTWAAGDAIHWDFCAAATTSGF